MKKKLLASVITIAMLVSLMVTATFALFTSSVNLSDNKIKAGKVDLEVKMSLAGVKEYGEGDYRPVANDATSADFAKGYTDTRKVEVANAAKIEMSDIVPGDSALFKLDFTNNSTVKTKYLVVFSTKDLARASLFNLIQVDEDGAAAEEPSVLLVNPTTTIAASSWADLEVKSNPDAVYFTLGLNSSVGNDEQLGEFVFDINVFAVQANGVSGVVFANSVAQLEAAPAGSSVFVLNDIDATGTTINANAVNLNLGGKTIKAEKFVIEDNAAKSLSVSNGLLACDVVITANNAHVDFSADVLGSKTITAATAGDSFDFKGKFVDADGKETTGTIVVVGGKLIIEQNTEVINVEVEPAEGAKQVSIVVAENAIIALNIESVTTALVVEKYGVITKTIGDESLIELHIKATGATITAPTKKEYDYEEEKLDLTDGKIKVTDDNNNAVEVDMDDPAVTVSGYNSTKPGVQTITVTFQGVSATFEVTVGAKPTSYVYVGEELLGKYVTPQDAVDAINGAATPTALTEYVIELIAGTYTDTIGIKQQENKSITIRPQKDVNDPKKYVNVVFKNTIEKSTNVITIDGDGRFYKPEGVTISHLNFDLTNTAVENCIKLDRYNRTGGNHIYAHNIVVENCTFKGIYNKTVAVQSMAGGMNGLIVRNCEAENMHSLVQAKALGAGSQSEVGSNPGLLVEGCTLKNAIEGINFYGNADVNIIGCKIYSDAYAVRSGGSSGTVIDKTLTISGCIFITNSDVPDNVKNRDIQNGSIILRIGANQKIEINNSTIENRADDGVEIQNIVPANIDNFKIDVDADTTAKHALRYSGVYSLATLYVDNNLEGKKYPGPQEAVDAVTTATTGTDFVIKIAAGTYKDKLEIIQQAGKNVTICPADGAKVIFKNTISIDGNGKYYFAEKLKIKNIEFDMTWLTSTNVTPLISKSVATEVRCIDTEYLRLAPAQYVYGHNITIDGCIFRGPEAAVGKDIVAIKTKGAGTRNLSILNCEAYNMHSLVQAVSVMGLLVDHCKVRNSSGGVNHYGITEKEVTPTPDGGTEVNEIPTTISYCDFEVDGYAVRSGQGSGTPKKDDTLSIKNCIFKTNGSEDKGSIILRGDTAAKVKITECSITNNDGVVIQSLGNEKMLSITITDCNTTGWQYTAGLADYITFVTTPIEE